MTELDGSTDANVEISTAGPARDIANPSTAFALFLSGPQLQSEGSRLLAYSPTVRAEIVGNVPARLARRLTLQPPERWPWSEDFSQLFRAVHAPPPTA